MAFQGKYEAKYKEQAIKYNNKITDVNERLNSALTELNGVDTVLGLDPNNAHDVLTYNVLVSNNEIKTEIMDLVSDLSVYGQAITNKAEMLDQEEKELYDHKYRFGDPA